MYAKVSVRHSKFKVLLSHIMCCSKHTALIFACRPKGSRTCHGIQVGLVLGPRGIRQLPTGVSELFVSIYQ